MTLVSRHRIISKQEDTDTTIAVSNNTKAVVLAKKKTGERYNETIKRIFSEYNSLLQMPIGNEIQR